MRTTPRRMLLSVVPILVAPASCQEPNRDAAQVATATIAVSSNVAAPSPSVPSPSAPSSTAPSDIAAPRSRIYASTDDGESWHPSDRGFPPLGTVVDFAVAGGAVFAATSEHGVYVSRDDGKSWAATAASFGIDDTLTAIAFGEAALFVGTRRSGVFTSSDDGKSWDAVNQGLKSLELRCLLALEGRLFAATNGGLFSSESGGKSWRHLTGTGQTNSVVVQNGNLYVASIDGIQSSSDKGGSWTTVYSGDTPHNLSATKHSVFAMLYGKGVIRSDDNGGTWQSAQLGLPDDLSLYTFQITHAHGRLYAGQWHGLYVSALAGNRWVAASKGISSDDAITDIVAASDRVLLAGAVASSPRR